MCNKCEDELRTFRGIFWICFLSVVGLVLWWVL